MRNQGQLIFGGFLLLIGVMLLLGNLFQVNIWSFCWPIGLILLGVWLVVRPRMISSGSRFDYRFLGNFNRSGKWEVSNEELWAFIGEVRLDLREALIPSGETTINIYCFIGDIELSLPTDSGLSITATGFITDSTIGGHKQDSLLIPVKWESQNYSTADRKLHLAITGFIIDLDAY